MKNMKCKMLIAGVLAALTSVGSAAFLEDLDTSVLRIDGTEITSTAAEINRAADVSAGLRSLTVTNGQAITLTTTDKVIALTSEGAVDAGTNTVTMAVPYPVGQEVLFRVVSGSTNLVTLADATTTLSLGSDAVLGPTDTLKIYTAATNEAVKVSTSDN